MTQPAKKKSASEVVKIVVVALMAIGALRAACVCADMAEDDRVAAASAIVAGKQSDTADALRWLDTLDAKDPAAVWAAKCSVVENKGGTIPNPKREPCAKAFASSGRASLKAGALADAIVALEAAKRLGAESVDGDLAKARERKTKADEVAGKIAAREAAKARALRTELGPEPTLFPRTGGCVECEVFLDTTLKDPASFERIAVSEAKVVSKGARGRFYSVALKYRATNSFGARVVEQTTFLIRNGRVVATE